MRRLNAKMWGHSGDRQQGPSRAATDPVKLGGCGRVCEGGSQVPVYAHEGRWLPGSLATCDNMLLCDFCGPRKRAESAARFEWHFADWLAAGGTLLHLRLSIPHRRGDSAADLLAALKASEVELRKSPAWRRARIVDWVRVLDVTFTDANGWNLHYHVTAFVPARVAVDIERTTNELQGAWRDGLIKRGYRASKRHGLFARVFGSTFEALYAWREKDDDDEADGDDRYHPMADRTDDRYHPMHDRGSVSLTELATAAIDADDQQAWRLWEELCRALKGVPVVKASRMLDRLWKAHQADMGEPEPVDIGEPVALVDARLWERARREGCTQLGLQVGSSFGVEAMAQWWATELGVKVQLYEESTPRLVLANGPPG